MSTLTNKYGRKFYKSKEPKEKTQLNNQLSDSLAELFKISRNIDAKQKFNESIIASRTLPRLREDSVDGVAKLTVENNSGSTLPSTGGIGTTIFYIIGGLMIIGAFVAFIVKRRMSAEK